MESHLCTNLLQPLQRCSQLYNLLRGSSSSTYYELNTAARSTHSKDSFRSIFPKQWRGGKQETFPSAPIIPMLCRGCTHTIGKLLCPLLLWENTHALLRTQFDSFSSAKIVKWSFCSSFFFFFLNIFSAVWPLNQVAGRGVAISFGMRII